MTPNQKEAYDHMQKALEKLLPMARKHGTLFGSINPWTEACDIGDTAITAAKKVQNEQAQSVEPFAWVRLLRDGKYTPPITLFTRPDDERNWVPLYLHPPQPQATTPAVPELLEELENCRDLLKIAFPDAPVDSCIGVGIIKASAAIAAAQGEKPRATTPVVPEGYVLVPVEPTPAMCAEGLEDEGLTIKDGFKYAYALYKCMVKTAQGEKP